MSAASGRAAFCRARASSIANLPRCLRCGKWHPRRTAVKWGSGGERLPVLGRQIVLDEPADDVVHRLVLLEAHLERALGREIGVPAVDDGGDDRVFLEFYA